MKSRFSCWLTSSCASFAPFVRHKLRVLGEMIALQLERSYPGEAYASSAETKRLKISAGFLSPAKWYGRRNKLRSNPLPPMQ
jgi:hypothetical protein